MSDTILTIHTGAQLHECITTRLISSNIPSHQDLDFNCLNVSSELIFQAMVPEANKTDILVLGTLHLDERKAPFYIRRLKEVVQMLKPAVICAELLPEQLAGEMATGSKPEYESAILPVAKQLEIPVVSMSGRLEEGRELDDKLREIERQIADDILLKTRMDMIELLVAKSYTRLHELVRQPEALDMLQAEAYHLLSVAPRHDVLESFFPDFHHIWTEYNERYFKKIIETVGHYPAKLVLVTIGLDHKFWLDKKLAEVSYVRLRKLSDYEKCKESNT